MLCCYGPVAQLGERCVRNAEVESSILFGSTTIPRTFVLGIFIKSKEMMLWILHLHII